jgi:hypothetical protein
MGKRKINSFEDFWPLYLKEHSRPLTRKLHLIGTILGLACAIVLIIRREWLLIPIALLPGYITAWFSHFFVEGNRPATFKYPIWSFVADFKMAAFMITGKIENEIIKTSGKEKVI